MEGRNTEQHQKGKAVKIWITLDSKHEIYQYFFPKPVIWIQINISDITTDPVEFLQDFCTSNSL